MGTEACGAVVSVPWRVPCVRPTGHRGWHLTADGKRWEDPSQAAAETGMGDLLRDAIEELLSPESGMAGTWLGDGRRWFAEADVRDALNSVAAAAGGAQTLRDAADEAAGNARFTAGYGLEQPESSLADAIFHAFEVADWDEIENADGDLSRGLARLAAKTVAAAGPAVSGGETP